MVSSNQQVKYECDSVISLRPCLILLFSGMSFSFPVLLRRFSLTYAFHIPLSFLSPAARPVVFPLRSLLLASPVFLLGMFCMLLRSTLSKGSVILHCLLLIPRRRVLLLLILLTFRSSHVIILPSSTLLLLSCIITFSSSIFHSVRFPSSSFILLGIGGYMPL